MARKDFKLTGWHVLGIFGGAFGVIIGVNIALAVNAVSTFPGLEVANSYVASQTFDKRRAAQDKAGWKPAEVRKRRVTPALKAYAAFATSAAEGAVRKVPD